MKQYLYHIEHTPHLLTEEQLNEWGGNCWALVNLMKNPDGYGWLYTFMKG